MERDACQLVATLSETGPKQREEASPFAAYGAPTCHLQPELTSKYHLRVIREYVEHRSDVFPNQKVHNRQQARTHGVAQIVWKGRW